MLRCLLLFPLCYLVVSFKRGNRGLPKNRPLAGTLISWFSEIPFVYIATPGYLAQIEGLGEYRNTLSFNFRMLSLLVLSDLHGHPLWNRYRAKCPT